MKMTTSARILFILLFPFSTSSFAQELFKSVETTLANSAANYNSRFLSERLYFAKRHRIVEVDVGMLRETGVSGVTLFEGDDKVELRRERMHEGQIHGAATWIGNVVFPNLNLAEDQFRPEDLEMIRKSGLTLDQVVSQIGRVELFVLYWDVDEQTGEAFPSAERRNQGLAPAPVEGATDHQVRKHAFASVSGEINLSVAGGGVFRLEPLRYSPRYHVLYEVDPSKTFGLVEEGAGTESQVTAKGRKKLAYDEYVKALPPESKQMVRGELL